MFFDTEEQARKNGIRPCKRWRPDLLEFQPKKENAEKIKLTYVYTVRAIHGYVTECISEKCL